MSDLLDTIRTRGHWEVSISPTTYQAERVSYADLRAILESLSVNLRGWDFPHIDPHAEIKTYASWIEQESEWHQYLESWRFYQSGQFIDISGFWEDWLDQSWTSWRPDEWEVGKFMGVANTIFRFVEIFEFAARLASTLAGDDTMHIAIKLVGLEQRMLHIEDRGRAPFSYPRKTAMAEFAWEKDIVRAELLADPRVPATEGTLAFFERFGWTPPADQITDWQAKIGR